MQGMVVLGGHPNLECGTWGLKLSYRKAGRPPSRPWMTWAEVQGDRPGPLGGERAGLEASSWSDSGGEGIPEMV